MKCKDCKKFIKLKDTTNGICKFENNFHPANQENDCFYDFRKRKLKCSDCLSLVDDTACMTCDPNQEHNSKCSGLRLKISAKIVRLIKELDSIDCIDWQQEIKEIIKYYKIYKRKLKNRN